MEIFSQWLRISVLLATFMTPPPAAAAGDWPQWRGPNRNGNVSGVSLPAAWPTALKEQWKVTVGVGYSSPLVVDGKIFHHTRIGEDEVLLCLDAASGKELWRSAPLPAPYKMHEAAVAAGKGPKSTPVASNGKIFTLGITGVLSAHDARNGKLLWRKDFSKQFPATSPLYGTSMSPLVENGMLIAHVGGQDKGALMAFDTSTGAVKWSYDGDGPGYASPIIATLAGVRQIITFTQKELVGIGVADGKLLWKVPAKAEYDDNNVTPIVYKDMLIVSKEREGMLAFRITKQGAALAAQEVWRNADNQLYMNSPVLEGNLLYGLSIKKKGQFFCLDADTGKTIWQSEGRMGENAALLNVGKAILLLTDEAKLIVIKPGAAKFEPVMQYTVATSPTWAHPVFLGNRILVKDETTLASLAF
jgi:outer membrane protein assembly factor BamB